MEATANLTPQQPKKSGFKSFIVIIFVGAFMYYLYGRYEKNVEESKALTSDSTEVITPVVDSSAISMDTATVVR